MNQFHELASTVARAAQAWLATKASLEAAVPFSSGWLHLAVGPLIFVAAALAMRKPLSSWWPWLIVLVLGVANEIIDLALGVSGVKEFGLSGTDLLLTLAIPTIMLALARATIDSRGNVEAPGLRQ